VKFGKELSICMFIYLSIYLLIYLSFCLSIYLSIYGSTALMGFGRFFSFVIFYTVGRLLPAHRTAQTQNKRTQISVSLIGFEPTVPVFERTKTVHALDRAATLIGLEWSYEHNFCVHPVAACRNYNHGTVGIL
jgi:hypothetical protein